MRQINNHFFVNRLIGYSVNRFLIIFFTFYLLPFTSVNASAIDISSKPTEVNMREEFTIRLNTTGLTPNTTYRLRVAFYKENGKYFGETWNGASWVGLEEVTNPQYYYGILTDKNGNWAGEMKGKVNYEDFNFPKTLGTMKFKILRFTESGNPDGESESYPIELKDPNPSGQSPPGGAPPTSTPTIIPTNTPSPFPTNTPTPVIVISPTTVISPVSSPAVESVNSSNPTILPLPQNISPNNPLIFFSIWLGISLLLIIAVLIYWRVKYK